MNGGAGTITVAMLVTVEGAVMVGMGRVGQMQLVVVMDVEVVGVV